MSDAGSPELAALRGLGEEWGRALAGRSEQLRALPVDPDLGDLAAPRGGRRRGRFVAPVDFVSSARKDEVTATAEAEAEPTRVGSALLRIRRVLLGPPLALTAVALERMRKLVAAATKFTEGAWVAVLLVAGLSLLGWRIRRHYEDVSRALAIDPRAPAAQAPATPELEAPPRHRTDLVVVPVLRLDLLPLQTLSYATTLGAPVLAVHVSTDPDDAKEFRRRWEAWGLTSRSRSSTPPTARRWRRSPATCRTSTPSART